ncbi:hypothetical protein UY3_12522 [Chelonia mydas]|uniref:Uncharacterized protein n=1 Tax=Chelonia mydas TaxID=8469 RepID=M7B4D5_CHEMY|nr:hypothetical protein UY3_12522 [Chelonia mydas]
MDQTAKDLVVVPEASINLDPSSRQQVQPIMAPTDHGSPLQAYGGCGKLRDVLSGSRSQLNLRTRQATPLLVEATPPGQDSGIMATPLLVEATPPGQDSGIMVMPEQYLWKEHQTEIQQ